MSFFVLGLPRSRTAWLSVFLSQSGTHCYHEGINGCRSINEYSDKIQGCGDSTTAFTYIDKLYTGHPTVIIDKTDLEFSRCLKWCERFGDVKREMIDQRDTLLSIDGLRVMQSDIDLRLEEIFEHLTGAGFLSHHGELSKLHIEADPFDIDYVSMRELLNA